MSEFVRVSVVDDVTEIAELTILARSFGYLLVCDGCRRESEPLAAILTILWEPKRTYGYCGGCFREISSALLGVID